MKKLTILAVVILLILTAVANVSLAADFPSAFISELSQKEGHYYEVKRGESFWKIAEDRLGDPLMHNFLFKLNKDRLRLQNPEGLKAGQEVFIPGPENGKKEKYYLETKVLIDKTPRPTLAKSLNAPAIIMSFLLLNIMVLTLFVRKSKRELTFFSFLFLLSSYFVLEPVPVSTYTLTREMTEYYPEPEYDNKERMKDERMAFIRRAMTEFQLSLAAEELDKEQEWSERWLDENGKLKHEIISQSDRELYGEVSQRISEKYPLLDSERGTFMRRMFPFEEFILRSLEKYGIQPEITKSLIIKESSVLKMRMGDFDEKGLMQIRPETAKRLGVENPEKDLLNPEINIDTGSKYVFNLWNRFGNVEKALASYNWGPTNVILSGGVIREDIKRGFVNKILNGSDELANPILRNGNYFDRFYLI